MPWISEAYLELCKTNDTDPFLAENQTKNSLRKQFMFLDCTAYFTPDENFEPFVVELNSDLSMETNVQFLFYFQNHNQSFWKNIKICILENSCLSRLFSWVHFKAGGCIWPLDKGLVKL